MKLAVTTSASARTSRSATRHGRAFSWTHSSGHHRNLLNPSHTEIGIGGIGRYWVQNFGVGNDWREHAPGTDGNR